MALAATAHAGQTRKGTDIPYVSHLLAVAALVLEDGGDEDQAVAALLHDTLEDTVVTEAELRSRFGDRVADIVVACTDTTEDPKPPWRPRKEAYIAHLRADAPVDALRVAVADKLHNARSLVADVRRDGPSTLARFNAGAAEQLWYLDSLVDVFSVRAPGPLTEELRRCRDDLRTILDRG